MPWETNGCKIIACIYIMYAIPQTHTQMPIFAFHNVNSLKVKKEIKKSGVKRGSNQLYFIGHSTNASNQVEK